MQTECTYYHTRAHTHTHTQKPTKNRTGKNIQNSLLCDWDLCRHTLKMNSICPLRMVITLQSWALVFFYKIVFNFQIKTLEWENLFSSWISKHWNFPLSYKIPFSTTWYQSKVTITCHSDSLSWGQDGRQWWSNAC